MTETFFYFSGAIQSHFRPRGGACEAEGADQRVDPEDRVAGGGVRDRRRSEQARAQDQGARI